MVTKRLPLSQRHGMRPTPEPSEGVPAHLRRSLVQWFVGWSRSRDDVVKRIALRLQVPYGAQWMTYGTTVPEAVSFMWVVDQTTDGGRLLLDAVDELLEFRDVLRAVRGDIFDPEAWEQLDQALEDSGSVWRVGPTREQLVRRVDDAVQQVADEALKHAPPTAGEHLAAAWSAIYGRRPIPTAGTTRRCWPSRPRRSPSCRRRTPGQRSARSSPT